jgi:hypothetical protein
MKTTIFIFSFFFSLFFCNAQETKTTLSDSLVSNKVPVMEEKTLEEQKTAQKAADKAKKAEEKAADAKVDL